VVMTPQAATEKMMRSVADLNCMRLTSSSGQVVDRAPIYSVPASP
jgi:hypothetical protein